MKVFLVTLAILTAVLGTVAPASVYAEPAKPAVSFEPNASIASLDTVRYNRPQTRAWFEEVTGFHSPYPPAFAKALAELDAYWDSQAIANCGPHGCQPRFGGTLLQGACNILRRGDVFWGGYYDPANLPDGIEPLILEETAGWVGVYSVISDKPTLPSCAGGRWLRELKYVSLPLILR